MSLQWGGDIHHRGYGLTTRRYSGQKLSSPDSDLNNPLCPAPRVIRCDASLPGTRFQAGIANPGNRLLTERLPQCNPATLRVSALIYGYPIESVRYSHQILAVSSASNRSNGVPAGTAISVSTASPQTGRTRIGSAVQRASEPRSAHQTQLERDTAPGRAAPRELRRRPDIKASQ